MRLIKIEAPQGKGDGVIETAFSVGIKKVSIHQVESRRQGGASETRDVVDIETSTPRAKQFVDELLAADFYDPKDFTVSTRGALSIISQESLAEITRPLPDIVSDISEELFQFSHITYGFVGRVFISACLIAYGMIQQNLLVLIAGLLFLPLLPLLHAVGFGGWTRSWKLCGQGAAAFSMAIFLLVAGGAIIAGLCGPPLRYQEFSAIPVGFLMSLAVGTAAGLAIIDDAGKREMIGLAATAQIAIIPVWIGISMVFGFDATTGESHLASRIFSFFLNVLTIIAASLAVYILSGAAKTGFGKIK